MDAGSRPPLAATDAPETRGPPPPLPASIRARGGVRIVIAPTPRGAAPLAVAESGGYRVRFPRTPGRCEGVLINTGGGLAGGDRMAVDLTLQAGAQATLTTQSAEKIYRSDGDDTEVSVAIALRPGSRLDWLPQEQIVFSGARFRRTLGIEMAADATLTLVESTVFGRVAGGESVAAGAYRDRWRVRRAGRLVFAEEVRLEGAIDRQLARRAVADGASAVATVLHVALDAEARLEPARALLAEARSEAGASAWNGMLLARFLARDPHALKRDLVGFLAGLRGSPLPRSWQS